MVNASGARLRLGQKATSIKGRDFGREYLIVGFIDENFLLVADGVLRPFRRPKKKNIKHVMVSGVVEVEIEEKISTGQQVSDDELRRALEENG